MFQNAQALLARTAPTLMQDVAGAAALIVMLVVGLNLPLTFCIHLSACGLCRGALHSVVPRMPLELKARCHWHFAPRSPTDTHLAAAIHPDARRFFFMP